MLTFGDDLMSSGNEFHRTGAADEKQRRPYVASFHRGTSVCCWSEGCGMYVDNGQDLQDIVGQTAPACLNITLEKEKMEYA